MDTISWTELSRKTHLFLKFASAQIFRLDVQFSAKEKYTKSLYMPKCLLYLVWFFAVLLVCGLLIKSPHWGIHCLCQAEKGKFWITCRTILLRDQSLYVDCAWVPIACYIPCLPGKSRTLAGLPHAHIAERPFVSILELSWSLLVHFVVSPRLIILQLCKRRWCGWLLPSAFVFSIHKPHSCRLSDCSHFLLLVCGFCCMFSIWKKTLLGFWGTFSLPPPSPLLAEEAKENITKKKSFVRRNWDGQRQFKMLFLKPENDGKCYTARLNFAKSEYTV